MSNLNNRLDKIIPKIKEEKFLEGRGLGNEISFYVFDYEPEHELFVRDYVKHVKKEFNYEGSNRKIIEFDLYKMMVEIAKEKRIFERIFQMEEKQGRESLFRAMKNFTAPEIFLKRIKRKLPIITLFLSQELEKSIRLYVRITF